MELRDVRPTADFAAHRDERAAPRGLGKAVVQLQAVAPVDVHLLLPAALDSGMAALSKQLRRRRATISWIGNRQGTISRQGFARLSRQCRSARRTHRNAQLLSSGGPLLDSDS